MKRKNRKSPALALLPTKGELAKRLRDELYARWLLAHYGRFGESWETASDKKRARYLREANEMRRWVAQAKRKLGI